MAHHSNSSKKTGLEQAQKKGMAWFLAKYDQGTGEYLIKIRSPFEFSLRILQARKFTTMHKLSKSCHQSNIRYQVVYLLMVDILQSCILSLPHSTKFHLKKIRVSIHLNVIKWIPEITGKKSRSTIMFTTSHLIS